MQFHIPVNDLYQMFHLFKGWGAGQEVSNAVDSSIDFLFAVSFNWNCEQTGYLDI